MSEKSIGAASLKKNGDSVMVVQSCTTSGVLTIKKKNGRNHGIKCITSSISADWFVGMDFNCHRASESSKDGTAELETSELCTARI